MRKTLGLSIGLLLMTAAPMVVYGHDDHHDERYWDRDGRDWHEWNEREEHAWREYLRERRWEYRAWNRCNRREQRAYWRWRHHHPDAGYYPGDGYR